MFGVRIVPRWATGVIVTICAVSFTLALHDVRRSVARNLELVLGPTTRLKGWLRAYRTILPFSWCLTERYEQFLPTEKRRVFVDHEEAREFMKRIEGPVVFVTAHYGGWEIGSLATQEGADSKVLHSVREQEIDPESNAYLERLLSGLGGAEYKIHYANSETLAVELLAALRSGDWVAVQGDRPPASGKPTKAQFFEHPIEVPLGPAVLARLSGAPLVPIFTHREGRGKYKVELKDPIYVPRTADRSVDLDGAMQAVTKELEEMVRAYPHQWFCLRDVRNPI